MRDICKFKKTKRQCLQQELEENLDKKDLGTEIDEMESLGREILKDMPKNMSDVIFSVRLPQYEVQH
ncbi:hypothetical protein T07_2718 [Trichinella nelsoni]|uniref:Uncharacterized protein n=1 Tax=Trichinella nelsoni TaxID=6336 RepID=A0A0V0RS45_9BILA|nr:hypothetical protein T07_2718 [Trichinella nelsoni]